MKGSQTTSLLCLRAATTASAWDEAAAAAWSTVTPTGRVAPTTATWCALAARTTSTTSTAVLASAWHVGCGAGAHAALLNEEGLAAKLDWSGGGLLVAFGSLEVDEGTVLLDIVSD